MRVIFVPAAMYIYPDNFNHGYDTITVSLVFMIKTSGGLNRDLNGTFSKIKKWTKCIEYIRSKTLKQSTTSYSPIQKSIRIVLLPQKAGQLSKSPNQYSFQISSLWCIKVVNKDSLVR